MNATRTLVPFACLAALLVAVPGCTTRRPLADGTARSTAAPPAVPPAATPVPAADQGRVVRSETTSPNALGAGFDLGTAIEEAAAHNPRLAAARNRWLAATQRPAQARALPDPLLTYTEMVEPIRTRAGPIDRNFQITQKIPFPGKLSAAGAVAEEQARVSRLEYDIALRDTIAEIKVCYAELVYLHEAVRIVEQNQGIAQQLADKGAALYGGAQEEGPDTVTLFDTLKAQSQLAQLAYDLITLRELLATEEARMNELLSRPAGSPLGEPRAPAFRPLDAEQGEILGLAMQKRQELEAALHRISAAEHGRRLARLSRVPDFTIGAAYWMVGEQGPDVPHSGDDAAGLSVGVTLPIWAKKNAAKIAEAEYLKRAACLDRQAEVDGIQARIAKVWFKLQNADRLARLYRETLIPQAAEAMEVAEQWTDTGREPFGRLLEAQSVWLNFQLAYHRALADHEQMVARLEQLVGISLGHLRGKETP